MLQRNIKRRPSHLGYDVGMRIALACLLLLLVGCKTTPKPSPETETTSSAADEGDDLGEGNASWYGGAFAGKKTANGELFDPNAFTAAHRKLKFGTCVKVELISSGATVDVRINDRGPFVKDRIIDLSEAAARQLGFLGDGVGRVRLSECVAP